MRRRKRRTLVLFGMIIVALLLLSKIVPNHSSITVSGPDGEYRIESTGQGPQHVRLELGDGSFVESGAR